MFNINEDYKVQFEKAVTELTARNMDNDQERIQLVDELINQYVDNIGEIPDAYQLGLLTNYILSSDLKNKKRWKTKEVEFLSESQLKRRKNQEVSFTAAEPTYGSDKRNKANPAKKKFTADEQIEVRAFIQKNQSL